MTLEDRSGEKSSIDAKTPSLSIVSNRTDQLYTETLLLYADLGDDLSEHVSSLPLQNTVLAAIS